MFLPLVCDGNKFVNSLNECRNIDDDFVVIGDRNVKEVLEVLVPWSLKTERRQSDSLQYLSNFVFLEVLRFEKRSSFLP